MKTNPHGSPQANSTLVHELKRNNNELISLLDACKKMNGIQDLNELCTVLAGIVKEQTKSTSFSFFIYREKRKIFEQIFSQDLRVRKLSFKVDDISILQKFLDDEPFPVTTSSGQPIFPDLFKKYKLERLRSALWVPLVLRGSISGFFSLSLKKGKKAFDRFDLMFLKQISPYAATSVNTFLSNENRREEKEEKDKTIRNLSFLYNIGRALTYINDLKGLLQYIMIQAIQIAHAEKGSIMLYDPEKNLLNIKVLEGLPDKEYQRKVNDGEIKCKSFKPGEGVAGHVFQTGKSKIVNKTGSSDLFVEASSSFTGSIACIPMKVYNEIVGVINVTNKRDGSRFTKDDVEVLKAVADQAAVAINKAQLWEMSVTDSLTGLYLRRYFMAKFQDELYRADRYHKTMSIIMADLDNFKVINDTCGHITGDLVLKEVSKYFLQHIREMDMVARYGGEEFVVYLPETDKEAAGILAERLREGISKIKLKKVQRITISMGIAGFPADGNNFEMLVEKADSAMYAAKQQGRNRVVTA